MTKEIKRRRIGARGCPACGSHDTAGLSGRGAQWCSSCGHRWAPCRPHCRGYVLDTSSEVPAIRGCRDCGVSDRIARWWPEAYRAMSLELANAKMEPVGG